MLAKLGFADPDRRELDEYVESRRLVNSVAPNREV
jgi:hypothetical protein